MLPFTPTLRLHDRYVLRERIGLGGMSEVWRADDEVLRRPVAIKALAAQLSADPQLRATIQREARAAARLTHPHVTQVYDYGEAALPGGAVVPYLVMELVEGQNLADRLSRGPLAWPDAVKLAGQVAAALAAAHRIGVVHRDIKPGNVMLTETGAKVLDFGIAALAGPHHPLAGHGGGELLMGTPAYLAPERLAAGSPDPASDVYALGVLLYRTLSGRAPLPVQTWEDALEVHGRNTPVRPLVNPELPAEIVRLTMACLAADPARRPVAAELASRLGAGQLADPPTAILPTVAVPAHPPTLIDRAAVPARPAASAPLPRRSNRLVGVLVAAGLALIVGLVGMLAFNGTPSAPAADATAPAAEPTSDAPAPAPASEPPPSAVRPAPTTLRELAIEAAAVIAEAEALQDIDPEVADKLREELFRLNRGKLKDRVKRVEELRKWIDEAADEGDIGVDTAARLQGLLGQAPEAVDGGDDD